MNKLSERSIKIKELIQNEVCMGTFGLVELELIEFDKEIENLKHEIEELKNPKMKNPKMKKLESSYKIFYSGCIDIDGSGIDKITKNDDEISLEQFIEAIQVEFSNLGFHEIYDVYFYIRRGGNEFGGYILSMNYDPDTVD